MCNLICGFSCLVIDESFFCKMVDLVFIWVGMLSEFYNFNLAVVFINVSWLLWKVLLCLLGCYLLNFGFNNIIVRGKLLLLMDLDKVIILGLMLVCLNEKKFFVWLYLIWILFIISNMLCLLYSVWIFCNYFIGVIMILFLVCIVFKIIVVGLLILDVELESIVLIYVIVLIFFIVLNGYGMNVIFGNDVFVVVWL